MRGFLFYAVVECELAALATNLTEPRAPAVGGGGEGMPGAEAEGLGPATNHLTPQNLIDKSIYNYVINSNYDFK